ncbi:MAG: Hsp70 family protein, partial [Clostridiales bacterium]|nr:Hsp70 family protein [Clostridiales bacterium]
EVKRLMGSNIRISMAEKQYTPQEISAFLLKYLADCASIHLGETIDRAVITVPAYFSDEQRRATVEAGKLAGLKVDRIINEPTAASLDYGIEHLEECRNVLVYDLGGGTLDVTVLEMFEGVLEVKASSGNNRLGGKDFDSALMDYLQEGFLTKHGVDVSDDARAMMRLKDAAEKCKIALSGREEYIINLPFFADVGGAPVSLEEGVTRELLEGLIKGKIDSTEKQISVALKDAGLVESDIDFVLLVGGSTRIPYVRKFIENVMGKEPMSLVDPDLAVVRGASIQAGILNEELSSEKDIMITDVCPYTLGIAILDYIGGFPIPDVYDVIIPRNVTIPVVKEKIYGTVQDNQTVVEIKVYQGDYKKASLNNLLGKFKLEGIPSAPAFREKIKVSFSYDVNGILQTEGVVVSTGEKAEITVETTGVKMEEEVDLEKWKDIPNARKYRAIINKAQRILESQQARGFEMEMDGLVRNLKKGLIKGWDLKKMDVIRDDLQETINNAMEEEDD